VSPRPGPSRRPQNPSTRRSAPAQEGPFQGERKKSFEIDLPTAHPEQPPPLGGVSKGAHPQELTAPESEGEESHYFWRFIFGNDRPVEIEIGPGSGTFILGAARARQHANFLGLEQSRGRARRLQNVIEGQRIPNALVINADAACVVATLIPAASVAAYHVYFPDPWWKRRHHRRRLFTPAFAAALGRTLIPGGRVHLATDVDYVLQLAEGALASCGVFARDEHACSPRLALTAFERKGIARGATIHEATFTRLVVPSPGEAAGLLQRAPFETRPEEGRSSGRAVLFSKENLRSP
jgi:tRNA (guanine-N7-)-methyltransferase